MKSRCIVVGPVTKVMDAGSPLFVACCIILVFALCRYSIGLDLGNSMGIATLGGGVATILLMIAWAVADVRSTEQITAAFGVSMVSAIWICMATTVAGLIITSPGTLAASVAILFLILGLVMYEATTTAQNIGDRQWAWRKTVIPVGLMLGFLCASAAEGMQVLYVFSFVIAMAIMIETLWTMRTWRTQLASS